MAVQQMCRAMDALSGWLASNRLLLNTSKTQFIWLGGRRRLAGVDQNLIAESFPHVVFLDSVRDLGTILDQELSFPLTLISLPVAVVISFASCGLFLAPYLMPLLLPSSMHSSPAGLTIAVPSWLVCLSF